MNDAAALSDAAFAHSWFEEWRADPPVYGEATRLLMDLHQTNPEEAWRHIQVLVAGARTDGDLDSVGAGPLEDLLRDYDARFIDVIERKAAIDQKLRAALSHVWIRSDAPLVDRLRRLGCEVLSQREGA